jgi:hypothetical protein
VTEAKGVSGGASPFRKIITQSNETARVLDPLKRANVQKWDAPLPLKRLFSQRETLTIPDDIQGEF